jgi:hypothetical protein
MLREENQDFWLYPKLLLVIVGCSGLAILLNLWLPSSLAIILGFVPFFVVLTYAGRPLGYKQWVLRVLLMLSVLAALEILISVVKKQFGL